MSEYLNIRTLSLVTSIVSVAVFIALLYVFLKQKTYPGFGNWTIAYFCSSNGMILLGLRNVFPDFLTIILGNLLILGYFLFTLRGLRKFTKLHQKNRIDLLFLLFTTLMFIIFTYLIPSVNLRIIVISAIIFILCVYCCVIIWYQFGKIFANRQIFLFSSIAFIGIWHLIRLFLTIFFEQHISNFMEAGIIQGLSFLSMIIGIILIGLAFVICNAQRIEQDLHKAHNEIQTLTGMIPICSHCKKIRNDVGDWEQLENFISKHSEAYFSHGLCPDCAKEYYQEYL